MSVQRPGSAVTAGRRPPSLAGERLPRMTPFGEVGRRGVRAYAARGGLTEEAYLGQLGEVLTPEVAGSALVELERAEAATTAPSTCSLPPGCRSRHEHRRGPWRQRE